MGIGKEQLKTLALDLRDLFNNWLNEKEGRSEASLSRMSGLPDQKVRRMLEGVS